MVSATAQTTESTGAAGPSKAPIRIKLKVPGSQSTGVGASQLDEAKVKETEPLRARNCEPHFGEAGDKRERSVSKMEEDERHLSVGDTVLCRARGMESWPARVVDQNTEQLGEEVKRSKPRGNKHLLV